MYDTQICPWYFGSRNPDVNSNTLVLSRHQQTKGLQAQISDRQWWINSRLNRLTEITELTEDVWHPGAFSTVVHFIICRLHCSICTQNASLLGCPMLRHPLTFRHCFCSVNFLNDLDTKKFAPINQISALLSKDLPNSCTNIVSNLLA
jgi:hypothetical protein